MLRIGVISDLHLGYRQYGLQDRENDFYKTYDNAIDTIIDCRCNMVIMAGDMFHTHKPSPIAIKHFKNGLEKLKQNGIIMLSVIGNHTQLQVKGHFEPDRLFEDQTNFDILDKDHCFKQDDISIYGLPYFANHSLTKFKELVSELNEKATDANKAILVLHQEFQEFCGFTGAELSINDLDISNFDIIICGHIHSRLYEKLDNGWFIQPGSIERLNTAEAADEEQNGKGVTLIDVGDDIDVRFVRNDGLRKIFLEEKIIFGDMESTNNGFQSLLDKVEQEEEKPIVVCKIFDKFGQLELCKEWEKKLADSSLMFRMSYYDERELEIARIAESNSDLTPLGGLKKGIKDWDKDEADLAVELFHRLSSHDSEVVKSAQSLSDEYYNNHYI